MDSRENGIPDEKLVALAKGGNDDAFVELIGKYKGAVFGMVARIARDRLEIDELSQEVFVKAHGNLAQYRGDAPFGHWILRIASNTCRDALRKRKTRNVEISMDMVEFALSGKEPAEGDGERELRALDRAMANLGADQRMLITMLELDGKKVKDVASILGISEGNVKVRALRARRALKELFKKEIGRDG